MRNTIRRFLKKLRKTRALPSRRLTDYERGWNDALDAVALILGDSDA